jgi:hypothetical protein
VEIAAAGKARGFIDFSGNLREQTTAIMCEVL